MKKLRLKLLRDLAASKWLFLAVVVVVFLGVTFFGASYMAFQNLKASYDYSYQQLHFADFTIKVAGAPPGVLTELSLNPESGIKAVTERINIDLPLKIPEDGGKTVLARVISLPTAAHPAVNDVKVEDGTYLQSGDPNSLLVEKSFADYHGIKSGDSLFIITNDHETAFMVAGIVTSPEYIFPAKSRQEILVSPEVFGVIFVPQEAAAIFTDGNVNEFAVIIDSQADRAKVIAKVEEALSDYTILDVVTADEQPSNAALKLDLQEFGEMAEVFPLLFLIIGALVTYILLTRMVQNQRSEIGLMRAEGYSRRQVMVHYLSFALAIGVTGSVTGSIAGFLLSEIVTKLYITILGLPYTVIEPNWLAIEEGLFIGIIPSFIAGILPAMVASRLRPAEAMRPSPPATGSRLFIEKLLPLFRRLPFFWKLPLRNTFRNPRRSLSIIFGVAFGISLILVSAAFIDSVDYIIRLQYEDIQKYDAQINFAELKSADLITQVSNWPEVRDVEPTLQIPVRLQHAGLSYNTLVVGLPENSELFGLFSPAVERRYVSENGVLLSEALRGKLEVEAGDTLVLDTTFGSSGVNIDGFVQQPLGSFVYLSLEKAQELTGESAITGLMVSVTATSLDGFRETASSLLPGASVELTRETRQTVTDLFDLIKTIMWVMLAFGAALALTIVLTMVTLGILERRWEVATMRTLGLTRGRIAAMFTSENLLLGLMGILPGIPLGYGLALYFFSLFQTDMFSFYLVIFTRTYLLTVGLIILIVLLSQLPAIRQINRLDLAKMIKGQVT